jgi:hypothetical protein
VDLWNQDRQFYEAALAAIALAFAPAPTAHPAEKLTDDQRQLLQALLQDEPIWSCCGDIAPTLTARGLPASRSAMSAFLDDTGSPLSDPKPRHQPRPRRG